MFNQGYILADAFTDARGRYVPAAEVTRQADGWEYAGQPVTRRAGKMGKGLKNGISPDDIYDSYGADTLRLYEMAMGPLDGDRPWHTDDITGMHRFLQRLWRLIIDESTGQPLIAPEPSSPATPLVPSAPSSLAREPFPQADPALAATATVTLPVQVNGKVRFTIEVPASADRDDIANLLAAHPAYPRDQVARLVIVPGKIANIVLR